MQVPPSLVHSFDAWSESHLLESVKFLFDSNSGLLSFKEHVFNVKKLAM